MQSEFPSIQASNAASQGEVAYLIKEFEIWTTDDSGIAFQILSRATAVNPLTTEPEERAKLMRELNDELKRAVNSNPKRFAALAELPFQAPDFAIEEMRRCVKDQDFVGAMLHGSVGVNGTFLEYHKFDGLLSAFEELDVPFYLHLGIPPQSVMETSFNIPSQQQLSEC